MKYKLQPYVLSLRITERCNVGCFHCSLSAKPYGEDMSFDLAKSAILQASALGIGLLHISGGEPFLYPDLPAIVAEGRANDMVVEMVTSTFTNPGNEEYELNLLDRVVESGLSTILLSYDDGHARCVSLEKFSRFTQHAIDLGLDICIFCIDSPHFSITADTLLEIFNRKGIDINKLQWATGMFSGVGRGKSPQYKESSKRKIIYARCPYIMPVPTLTPDGKFLLCPCSILTSKFFTIGNYNEGMDKVFHNFEHSPVYRFLGKYGPHLSLLKCGFNEKELPFEMCEACKKYLDFIDSISESERIEIFKNQDLNDVSVDFDALLSPHKKYLQSHIKI